MALDFDLIVIGSGPGGYVAAIRAAQLGLKTAIVERELLGGVCLNWGCIPTKALLKSGEVYEQLSHLDSYGLSVEKPSFDFDKIVARSRGVAKQLNQGVAFLMKKHKIEVIEGDGQAGEGLAVAQGGGGAEGGRLAHGAGQERDPGHRRPRQGDPGHRPCAGRRPHLDLSRSPEWPRPCPKSLLVVGSGAIGVEFASFFRALGAEVTVIEALDRILPVEDEEVSKAAQKAFEKRGLKFRVGAKVTKLSKSKTGVEIALESGGKTRNPHRRARHRRRGHRRQCGEHRPGSPGREARPRPCGDRRPPCATNVPGLYAIGDVAGAPWLAHKASHEGVHCVEHIVASPARPGPTIPAPVPGCTYAQPQIASVGLTEAQAKKDGREIKVGRFPFRVNGKAIAAGELEGFVKTVFDAKTGQLLGAHMIGGEVTEMIQGFAQAMTSEATEAEIMATVFPHPTMSEAMHEATLDAFGKVIHL